MLSITILIATINALILSVILTPPETAKTPKTQNP